MIELKTTREIEIIKKNGRILAQTLNLLEKKIQPGIKTGELDRLAEEFIRKQGGYPAFKGYREYPNSICVSINDEIVHGIPGERVIQEGQIVSVDAGVLKDGYYADAACTYPVGEVSDEAQKLIRITRQALENAIDSCQSRKAFVRCFLCHTIFCGEERIFGGEGFSRARDRQEDA